MRPSVFSLLAGIAALARAEPLGDSDEGSAASTGVSTEAQPFPPMVELTQANWNDEVNKTRWLMVKHFRYVKLVLHLSDHHSLNVE